jgi:pSer/pThr/pTyr-binding forkhead associated (FHA) protein
MIGRNPDNDIALLNDIGGVSRKHAYFKIYKNQVVLIDTSTSG